MEAVKRDKRTSLLCCAVNCGRKKVYCDGPSKQHFVNDKKLKAFKAGFRFERRHDIRHDDAKHNGTLHNSKKNVLPSVIVLIVAVPKVVALTSLLLKKMHVIVCFLKMFYKKLFMSKLMAESLFYYKWVFIEFKCQFLVGFLI